MQWHMQDFVNGKAFCLFSKEPTGSEIRGCQEIFFQTSCVAITVEKLPRRCRRKKCDTLLISGIILAPAVNAFSR